MLNTWKSSLITPSPTVPAITFTKAPQALTTAYHNAHYFILACKYTSAITFDQAILFMDTTMQRLGYFLTPPEPRTQNCSPLGDPMLLFDPNTLVPAVMYACHMDGAVAEGSRTVFVAHLGLLGDSKPTTHEPRQGQVPGQRHRSPRGAKSGLAAWAKPNRLVIKHFRGS